MGPQPDPDGTRPRWDPTDAAPPISLWQGQFQEMGSDRMVSQYVAMAEEMLRQLLAEVRGTTRDRDARLDTLLFQTCNCAVGYERGKAIGIVIGS